MTTLLLIVGVVCAGVLGRWLWSCVSMDDRRSAKAKHALRVALLAVAFLGMLALGLVFLSATTGCATRRPKPPAVNVAKAEAVVARQSVSTEAARQTLYHQGETIQSVITASEEAQWALDAAERKNVIIEEHYRRRRERASR